MKEYFWEEVGNKLRVSNSASYSVVEDLRIRALRSGQLLPPLSSSGERINNILKVAILRVSYDKINGFSLNVRFLDLISLENLLGEFDLR